MIKIKKNKIFLGIIICVIIVLNCSNIYAKYIIQNEFIIANIDIDMTQPKIELVSIQNSEAEYKNYVNKEQVVIAKIKVKDKNLESINLDENHFKIKINDNIVPDINFEIGSVKEVEDGKIMEIQLSNLCADGKLKLIFLEGFAMDFGKLNNANTEISTDIVVDNSIPTVSNDDNEFIFNSIDGDNSEFYFE